MERPHFNIARSFVALWCWSLLLTPLSDAAPLCPSGQAFLNSMFAPMQETAIESELPITPQILSAITTSNGKDGGLFIVKDDFYPNWYQSELKAKGWTAGDVNWDELDSVTQQKLIEHVSKHRKQDFFQNRSIVGLKFKPKINLKFTLPTEFLGKLYPAGKHEVDVSRYLLPKVEYASPEDLKKFQEIELHFRGPGKSGEVSEQVFRLAEGLGQRESYQHAHIVEKLDVQRLARDPLFAPLTTEAVRRANIAAEVTEIVEGNHSIGISRSGTVTNFGPIQSAQLTWMTEYFQAVGKANRKTVVSLLVKEPIPEIGGQFKIGWVGMRGLDTYDQPGLWGLEPRLLSNRKFSASTSKNFLNGLQESLGKENYGIDVERFKKWAQVNSEPNHIAQTMEKTWYSYRVGTQQLPEHLTGILKEKELSLFYETASSGQIELGMLLHDWSIDPLFFDRPVQLYKIKKAQQSAIEDLKYIVKGGSVAYDPRITQRMKVFLLESGIYTEARKFVTASTMHP